jgi:hypothetical protein
LIAELVGTAAHQLRMAVILGDRRGDFDEMI